MKMHFLAKRILSTCLIGGVLLSSVSCGKKNNQKKEVVKEEDPYFTPEYVELDVDPNPTQKIEYSCLNTSKIIGNNVVVGYMVVYEYPQETMDKYLDNYSDNKEEYIDFIEQFYKTGFLVFDQQGNIVTDIPLPYSNDPIGVAGGKDGEVNFLIEDFEEQECIGTYVIDTYSAEGIQTGSVKVPKEIEYYPEQFYVAKNGNYILVGTEMIYVVSPSGEFLGQVPIDPGVDIMEQNGDVYLMSYEVSEQGMVTGYMQEFDPEAVKFKNDKKKLEKIFSNMVSGGDGNFYNIDGSGITRVDPFTGAEEAFFDWSQTDVNYSTYNEESFHVFSEDKIAFTCTEWSADQENGISRPCNYIVTLTRAEKNPHAGKAYIEMGTIGIPSYDLQNYIIRYNNEPDGKARIRVHDYFVEENTGSQDLDRKTDLSNRVYMDMINGKGPDILVDFAGYSQFNSEDVLVDLNKYVDGKNGLNREEYFDNVLTAFEDKDKLFQIPVCFDIRGLMANKEMIGERSGWTYNEFSQIVCDLPSDVKVFEDMEYKDLLYSLLTGAMRSFIDYTKKEVSFDGDEFKQLLQMVKTYGVEYVPKYDEYGNLFGTSECVPFPDEEQVNTDLMMNDKLALMVPYIYSLSQYSDLHHTLGEKEIFIGMPSPDGTGACASASLTLAISAFSQNKDESWDFIRRLFDEDSQYLYTSSLMSIPLSRKAFDRINQESIDERNRMLKENQQYAINYGTLLHGDIKPITEQDVQDYRELVESVSTIESYDPAVLNIILEESAAYFADQKDVDDVCAIIQNRTQTIVNER